MVFTVWTRMGKVGVLVDSVSRLPAMLDGCRRGEAALGVGISGGKLFSTFSVAADHSSTISRLTELM